MQKKRKAAGNRLRKLLRSTRLLACEVASIRVGLGNIAATAGETSRIGNEYPATAVGAADVSVRPNDMQEPNNLSHVALEVRILLARLSRDGAKLY